MGPDEIKDKLKNVINLLIKDQGEEADKELHDVLAAKMKSRITPEETVVEPDAGEPDAGDPDEKTDASDTDVEVPDPDEKID